MYYRQMFIHAKMKLYKTNKNVYLTEKEENDDVQNKDKIYFTMFVIV